MRIPIAGLAVLFLMQAARNGVGGAFRFTDRFSGYRLGSDGSPTWLPMTPTWRVSRGRYVQDDSTRYGTCSYVRAPVLGDLVFSARFLIEPRGAGVRAPGLVFRSQSSLEQYYAHFDSRSGQVLLQVQRPGAGGREVDIARVGNVPLAEGVWHEARVECRGPRIALFLDGRRVLEAEDATFSAGKVGLRAGQARVWFDDVRVEGTRASLVGGWAVKVAEPMSEHEVRRLRKCERVVAVRGQGYFPVLVKLRDGSLGAVVRGGVPHLGRTGRLDWIASRDGGRRWSPPRVVVDSEWDDRNPAVGVMRDGTIVVGYAEASTYNDRGEFDVKAGVYTPRYVLSTDGGRTWSEPRALDTRPIPNASPYGRIITLRDGTALMSLYQFPSEAVFMLRSRDNGRTWGDLTTLPGHDETALLELPHGEVLAFTRAEGSKTHALELSRSGDGGRTWSQPDRLLKPGQWPFDACLLSSGRVLLTYGNRTGPYGVGALLGDPTGRKWDVERRVLLAWECENADCGYPSTVQLRDGTLVTLYYAVGTTDLPGVEHAVAIRYPERALLQAMQP